MKKIIQTLKLRKFRTELNKSSLKGITDNDFLVWYKNGTCERAYSKHDLINILEKDHIKPIMYIFNATDRIVLERNIKIDLGEVENE